MGSNEKRMVQISLEDAEVILREMKEAYSMMRGVSHFLAEISGGVFGAERIKRIDQAVNPVRAEQVRRVATYYKQNPGVSLKMAARRTFVAEPGGYTSYRALSAYCYSRPDLFEGTYKLFAKEDF